jgi:selT/selW/selH-like putative selenoprotein
VSLAADIERETGTRAVVIPGTTGQFDVVRDGEIIFSKHSEGRFPEPDEILGKIES